MQKLVKGVQHTKKSKTTFLKLLGRNIIQRCIQFYCIIMSIPIFSNVTFFTTRSLISVMS